MSKLNDTYSSRWEVGWLSKKLQYYSQKLAIIDHINCTAGMTQSQKKVAKKLDETQGQTGLDGLANKIKKERV